MTSNTDSDCYIGHVLKLDESADRPDQFAQSAVSDPNPSRDLLPFVAICRAFTIAKLNLANAS